MSLLGRTVSGPEELDRSSYVIRMVIESAKCGLGPFKFRMLLFANNIHSRRLPRSPPDAMQSSIRLLSSKIGMLHNT